MTIAIRGFNEALDRAAVDAWWAAHKWPSIRAELLPPTGFIVPGVAVGWLYCSDGGFGWIEWIVSNPESDQAVRDLALDAIIDALIIKAKYMNLIHIFTSSNHVRLIERYKRHGFRVTDSNATHLIL